MKLHLRPAENVDHERVAYILIQSRVAYMPYAPSAHTEHQVRLWVKNHLIPIGGTTVAMLNGAVVGVSVVSRSSECSWIYQMYVEPSLVGQGIGSKLLEHALGNLPRPVRLYTFQANVGARRFYERNGFDIVKFTDGQDNEEHCPDVLYELRSEF